MRWWGWGEDGEAPALPPAARALLADELGAREPAGAPPRVRLAEVRLPAGALGASQRRALVAAVGADHVLEDRVSRVTHAGGKGYADLVRLRAGDGSRAPDAIVEPGSGAEVATALAACAAEGVAVVPFGGGTSVVGGVDALRGTHAAVIALDLTRLDRVLDLDRRSLTATVEAGMLGPKLERLLGTAGLTLGHFPQSFQYSSVGGWIATRSAGQASAGYGRIENLVEALRFEAPAGALATRAVPASAAGPPLRELLVGSEGTLGVVTAATLRVRVAPGAHRCAGWLFRSFEEGREALRSFAQADASPDLARLSDAEETRLNLALASTGGRVERIVRRYLRARAGAAPCLAITGIEGAPDDVARRRSALAEAMRAAGAVGLGEGAGRAWLQGRFAAPYLRDELLDRGVLVESFETAGDWEALDGLYHAVRDALTGALPGRGTVTCHVSHLYRSGASLYFTVLAPVAAGSELERWAALKRAALQAILASGGTITHHHGVGRDHSPWLAEEIGELGVEVLRAAKQRLDPAGIMNPGKLAPG